MALTDWVQTAAVIYFAWQQNRIFKQQNQIIANQSRRTAMQVESSRLRFLKRYWPTMAMVMLTLVTGYDIYDRHKQHNNPALAEFDTPHDIGVVEGFGLDAPTSCFMTVNGDALLPRQPGYKLAIGCFVYDGRQDILDAPYVQVSNLYDIKKGDIAMRCVFAEYFNEYRTKMNAIGINVALLNVPNGVQTSQFTTLRQARALGVLIPQMSIAKHN